MVEIKVTASAVASALLPAALLLASLFGWEVDETTLSTGLLILATLLIPVVTFIGGWLKKSATSAVSTGHIPPPVT